MVQAIEPIITARPTADDGRLHSADYADDYFGAVDAVAESRHHYLQGNQLAERFAGCKQFAIGELGFGTGLNFLLSWQCWREHAPTTSTLDYLAVEKHPIDAQWLAQIHAPWSELAELSQLLQASYPPALPGCHRLQFDGGRVNLTLVWGDAREQLSQLDGQLDAWFLDGFSPRANPQMWSEELLTEVARLTRTGGSFSTFSVAGAVRRALTNTGFDWQRQPGFGQKGQMLTGKRAHPPTSIDRSPWFKWPNPTHPLNRRLRVAVIGGGIAGTATAYALANKRAEVILFEQNQQLADGASGNPAGLVSPFLTADHSLASRFSCAAFEFARQNLGQLHKTLEEGAQQGWFHPVGELRLGVDQRSRKRHEQIINSGWFPPGWVKDVDPGQATLLAGVDIGYPGLFFNDAGWVEPERWCEALARAAGDQLQLRLSSEVTDIQWAGEAWQLFDAQQNLLSEVDYVVLANAADAARLLPGVELAISKSRGQVAMAAVTEKSANLRSAVTFGHYLLPANAGLHLIGSSYKESYKERHEHSGEQGVDSELHRQIVDAVEAAVPQLLADDLLSQPNGRISWRATTPDHLPLVGPVSLTGECQSRYSELHHGWPAERYSPCRPMPNLFLNIGHGSRGLVTAALSAELVACGIVGQFPPVDRRMMDALHPDRFVIRALRKPPTEEF